MYVSWSIAAILYSTAKSSSFQFEKKSIIEHIYNNLKELFIHLYGTVVILSINVFIMLIEYSC